MGRQDSPGIPDVPAPALLSFLKQVSSGASWDAKRLAAILNVKPADAVGIAAMLEMLGYVEPLHGEKNAWRNTPAGNTVSGAKPPRFNRESVMDALEDLRKRAKKMNGDRASPFHVNDLVAFGDFLDDHTKVQAADVGIGLAPKQRGETADRSAVEHKREEHVLGDLRGKSSMLHLQLLEDWMRKRSHERLEI